MSSLLDALVVDDLQLEVLQLLDARQRVPGKRAQGARAG